MLDQLEHDDFTGLPLLLPNEPWDDDVWNSTVQGRFFTYCDSLCQIHERGVALPYYQGLAERFPEWREELTAAIAAWRECAAYGGFLWKHLTMDAAGFEKFRDPKIRKILADEGYRSLQKDIEAVESIEKLLAAR
jgi:hypothetical protein